jgi:hypothetical protein
VGYVYDNALILHFRADRLHIFCRGTKAGIRPENVAIHIAC